MELRLLPLGDQAVMSYCANENEAARLASIVRRSKPEWCVDVLQAYTTVAVFYDLELVDFETVAAWLRDRCQSQADPDAETGRLHVIPCCYEYGLDFKRISDHTGLNREQVISIHTGAIFTVYAIGFCPGFPYLGYLPAELEVPRLPSPRLRVEAGSVAMTGRQTGIYTEVRPGGWNIIGRTPLLLVDVESEYFPLETGDRVQFRRIDEAA